EAAGIQIELSGLTDARTVGYNGPATIHSRSLTSLLGRKKLTFDSDGFKSDYARAGARTKTFIENVYISGGPLVQRIGTNRVYGNQATAAAIAGDHAASRLERRMDARTGEFIARANSAYNRKFRNALARRDAFPQVLAFSTTDE